MPSGTLMDFANNNSKTVEYFFVIIQLKLEPLWG